MCFSARALVENRNGLLVDLTLATGSAERDTPIHMLKRVRPRTLGADKAYDTKRYVNDCRGRGTTPNVATNNARRGDSAIDGIGTASGTVDELPIVWLMSRPGLSSDSTASTRYPDASSAIRRRAPRLNHRLTVSAGSPRQAPDKVSYQCRLAIWLTHLGPFPVAQVAAMIEVSKQAVWKWVSSNSAAYQRIAADWHSPVARRCAPERLAPTAERRRTTTQPDLSMTRRPRSALGYKCPTLPGVAPRSLLAPPSPPVPGAPWQRSVAVAFTRSGGC